MVLAYCSRRVVNAFRTSGSCCPSRRRQRNKALDRPGKTASRVHIFFPLSEIILVASFNNRQPTVRLVSEFGPTFLALCSSPTKRRATHGGRALRSRAEGSVARQGV